MSVEKFAERAKSASRGLAGLDGATKDAALGRVAEALKCNSGRILAANREDLARSERENLAGPLLKRLKFDEDKIAGVCAGIESLIRLDDPVGKTLGCMELDKGLELFKVSCPIGVIGVIFESRPDALVQISSLCLKSGNSVLLKGGSEASLTNKVLSEIIVEASESSGIIGGWLGLLESRSDVSKMLSLDDYIDLIVPRGSNEFVQHIMNNTNISVLGHADGVCHVYVDKDADLDMGLKICVDSKCQYVAVCNAAESIVVDKSAAGAFLPMLKEGLEEKGVEIRGCEEVCKIIDVKSATQEDWGKEYLDYVVSVKLVDGLYDAIGHINRYGSGHTDAIVTNNMASAEIFMNLVDSADVFLNCSTRFSDGFRYGLGAEVGISTNKIHARGPVGLEGLLIYKWKLVGGGHIVGDYSGGGFSHRVLDKEFGL